MGAWDRVYTDEQRAAIASAYFTARISNMAQIGRLARAGELTLEGKTLEPFPIPDASVRQIITDERRRREGRAPSGLAGKTAPDAVEEIRRRLVSYLDHETLRIDGQIRRKPSAAIDPEQIRKLARATRELALIPGPGEQRPAPGKAPAEAPTKADTIAGSLISAMGGESRPAQDDVYTPLQGDGEHSAPRATENTETENGADTDAPGSWERTQISGLRADAVITGTRGV